MWASNATAHPARSIDGVHVAVGASSASRCEGAIDQVELQRRADVALYQAKNDGRGCSRIYTADLELGIRRRKQMEADLRDALASGLGLAVHYQPIASLASGQIAGFEALARWDHPKLGPIKRMFYPIAEAAA